MCSALLIFLFLLSTGDVIVLILLRKEVFKAFMFPQTCSHYSHLTGRIQKAFSELLNTL